MASCCSTSSASCSFFLSSSSIPASLAFIPIGVPRELGPAPDASRGGDSPGLTYPGGYPFQKISFFFFVMISGAMSTLSASYTRRRTFFSSNFASFCVDASRNSSTSSSATSLYDVCFFCSTFSHTRMLKCRKPFCSRSIVVGVAGVFLDLDGVGVAHALADAVARFAALARATARRTSATTSAAS